MERGTNLDDESLGEGRLDVLSTASFPMSTSANLKVERAIDLVHFTTIYVEEDVEEEGGVVSKLVAEELTEKKTQGEELTDCSEMGSASTMMTTSVSRRRRRRVITLGS